MEAVSCILSGAAHRLRGPLEFSGYDTTWKTLDRVFRSGNAPPEIAYCGRFDDAGVHWRPKRFVALPPRIRRRQWT